MNSSEIHRNSKSSRRSRKKQGNEKRVMSHKPNTTAEMRIKNALKSLVTKSSEYFFTIAVADEQSVLCKISETT